MIIIIIDIISVREQVGKKIVEALTSKEAKVVLDPTLLLTKNDWMSLTTNKIRYEDKFLLTYFLDPVLDETANYINNLAQENNLIIRNLADRNDTELWYADPSEFINLFSQAQYVCVKGNNISSE